MPEIALLAPLVAWGLPGVPREPVPRSDLDVVAAASLQRVTGLVLEAADEGALADWPDEVLERLRDTHVAALRSNLKIEAAGVEAIDALTEAGLHPLWAKGGATAHLDYPDPAWRSVIDVDLIIRDDEFAEALEVLRARGCRQPVPPPSRRWERRFGKDATLVDAHGIDLDLHRTLIEGFFGIGIDNGELVAHTVPFTVGGHELRAHDAPGRLLHAAIHTAGSGSFRVSSARDVAQLVLVTRADWQETRRRAERWGCQALLAAGIDKAWTVLGLPEHEAARWARSYEPNAKERRALASLGRGGERLRMSGVAAVPWWRRPSYLVPLAIPSREHLRSRHRTYRDHVRITFRRLRASR